MITIASSDTRESLYLPSKEYDQNERVIYFSTFSKSLMPSLRMAYAVLPKSLILQYKQRFSYYSCYRPSNGSAHSSKFYEGWPFLQTFK